MYANDVLSCKVFISLPAIALQNMIKHIQNICDMLIYKDTSKIVEND